MKSQQLIDLLEGLKLRYDIITAAGSGKVVILERGARVIGLFTDEDSENALWVHHNLTDPHYASDHYVDGEDWNIGGDRTWLSPEIEYFIGDLDDLWNTYAVQRALDPGYYAFKDRHADTIALSQNTAIQAHRSNKTIKFRMDKTFRSCEDPLLNVGIVDKDTLKYSFTGYELKTELTLESPTEAIPPLSLWHLFQIPKGGEVIIPTYGTAEVDRFFGPEMAGNPAVSNGMVKFTLNMATSSKISIKAPYITGRVGYIQSSAPNDACLLIRNFNVNPSARYEDVWATKLNDPGHCVQCYNDDGTLGQFGELEIHTPILNPAVDGNNIKDVNQVWCYRGTEQSIRLLCKIILG
ncbi:DUF6786 family protein [Cohnella soli]|uniref:DUF6786 family protein n=1 Tax=Cohnella soli TaxID=425005 RepID=A0ABW0HSJ8_9BACL